MNTKILYCAIDSDSKLKYSKQCLSSILSLIISNKQLAFGFDINIVTNNQKLWQEWVNRFVPLQYIQLKIIDHERFNSKTAKHLKICAINELTRYSRYLIFIDTDTTFLEKVEIFDDSFRAKICNYCDYDLYASLECAPTDTFGSQNYNTGLLLIKNNTIMNSILDQWKSEYEESINTVRDTENYYTLPDQPIFKKKIQVFNPKIWTLHNIFNMRFHPNFESCEYLWSPVVMAHNHDLSNYMANAIFENEFTTWLKIYFNVKEMVNGKKDDNWKPRKVNLSSIITTLQDFL